jgi:hypothetical protein
VREVDVEVGSICVELIGNFVNEALECENREDGDEGRVFRVFGTVEVIVVVDIAVWTGLSIVVDITSDDSRTNGDISGASNARGGGF